MVVVQRWFPLALARFSTVIQTSIDHDTVEPSGELCIGLVAISLLHQGEENGLRDVAGILFMADEAKGDPKHELRVPLVKNPQRLPIAGGDVLHELFVVS